MNRFFAPGLEFTLIERLFPPERFAKDGKGLGDDAFLFEPTPGQIWAVTSDASAEDVHYRLDWVTPERALRKSLVANLSDINAMGGESRFAFLNLGAKKDWGPEVFDALGRALGELENRFAFRVSGGDTLRLSGPGFFAWTLLGQVPGRPLLRSACKPGHTVYISGFLGGSAAGLHILQQGMDSKTEPELEKALIEAHLDPDPPLALGPALGALDKSVGAIDLSDGLSSELWHLARGSGCAFRVEWSKLPKHPALGAWGKPDEMDGFVLDGGEEYQLLFTGDFSGAELARLRAIVPITAIGEVEKGEGVFLTRDGRSAELPAGGYSH